MSKQQEGEIKKAFADKLLTRQEKKKVRYVENVEELFEETIQGTLH